MSEEKLLYFGKVSLYRPREFSFFTFVFFVTHIKLFFKCVFFCNHRLKKNPCLTPEHFIHQYYFVLSSDVCCMKFVEMANYPSNL